MAPTSKGSHLSKKTKKRGPLEEKLAGNEGVWLYLFLSILSVFPLRLPALLRPSLHLNSFLFSICLVPPPQLFVLKIFTSFSVRFQFDFPFLLFSFSVLLSVWLRIDLMHSRELNFGDIPFFNNALSRELNYVEVNFWILQIWNSSLGCSWDPWYWCA